MAGIVIGSIALTWYLAAKSRAATVRLWAARALFTVIALCCVAWMDLFEGGYNHSA